MPKHLWIAAVVLGVSLPCCAASQDCPGISKGYQALSYPLPPSFGTWAILDRDGANRQVEPYLSSLGGGELGTGVIASPPFSVSSDAITFTICGHDGQGGGREENFLALVDAQTGQTLKKTPAPCSDPMQERSWDVGELQGREVRLEVHDGIAEGGYAWIGIGRIDTGPSLKIDFRQGMPPDWKVPPQSIEQRTELVEGGIAFLRRPSVYTMIPTTGVVEIPCGFAAERLFFLGCTVAGGRPAETYGHIEIHYRDGPAERYPLMFGFTLDAQLKLLSRSKAMHLHRSADPFEHYLVIEPRPGVIEKITLSRNPEHELIPRITAVTCRTAAASENLQPLPGCKPNAEEEAWIRSHTITADSPKLERIVTEIRQAWTHHE